MTENVFDQMEKEGINEEQTVNVQDSGEVNLDRLSDIPIADRVTYERENLDGQIVVIESAQLFNAITTEEPITALNDKSKKYWKCNFILTYDKKNKDGVNNREYISGAIQHVQRDGSPSPHTLWYEGASSQIADLWEKVAKFKKKKPEELSPREFLAFLNTKPKAKLKYTTVKYQKKDYYKNLVEEFVE